MLKPNKDHINVIRSNGEPTRFDKIISIIMNFNLIQIYKQ